MDVQLIKYKAPLTKDELSFLKQKEAKDRRQLFNVSRLLMIMCFICPFASAWVNALKEEKTYFSYFYYFLGVGFLLFFSGIIMFWTYRKYLYKVQLDIKQGSKIIDTVTITRKQYMPSNNSYFFYIDSSVKLSIEVNEEDYRKLEKGDEISIAYANHSKEYLGYI